MGAVVIELLGVDPVVLWILLPLVAFGSAYVPEVASFVAGQAAFTMMVLINFNLIVPTGWQVGLDPRRGRRGRRAGGHRGVGAAVAAGRDGGGVQGDRGRQRRRREVPKAAVLRVTRGASEDATDRVIALSHEALRRSRTRG